MAMTKKELAEFDAMREEVRVTRALRWSSEIPMRIDAENLAKELAYGQVEIGWWFNEHAKRNFNKSFIAIMCNSHSYSQTTKTDSQQIGGPWFASKFDALIALRQAVERHSAAQLSEIDRLIDEVKS